MVELGWSRERLASSSAEVVAAARWKLYVERLWPAELVATLDAPEPPDEPKARKNWEIQQRITNRRLIDGVRLAIFPGDEEPDSDG